MAELTRFGVSVDEELLQRFDHLTASKGYVNRSEAIRDLIRNALVEDQWTKDNEVIVGTITLVYNHHVRDLSEKLTALQHAHHHTVIATLHVHLDHHNCLEVIVVKAKVSQVKKLADGLIGTKGVKHGKLVTTTTGKHIP